MELKKKGITVAGSLIADIFYKIDTYPEAGMLTKARDPVSYVGGTGNLIQDLAKMDPQLPLRVSALVGADENGEMLCERLRQYPAVDVSGIVKEGISAQTLVMNAQDTKQRTFFFVPASSDLYEEKYIDWEKVDARIFHLEYLLLMAKVDGEDPEYGTHGARILHSARERGMKTSIDIVSEQSDRARKIVRCALRYTDYCTINEVEAEAVTGISLGKEGDISRESAKAALDKLKELGVAKWAVIHSPRQNFGLDCETGEFVEVASLSLPDGYIKGTNGAGDAYCSGILYGGYQGYTLKKAMRLAAASAACSLSEMNGTDGMRPEEEIWELEEKYGVS